MDTSPHLMTWTELPDKFGTTMTECRGSFDDLVNRLRTAGTFPSKDRCPWVKLATFGRKRSANGSLRTNENLVSVYGIELDYDGEQVSIEAARDKLERYGIKAALYPSPSSTAEKPRWRVLCPTAQQQPPTARAALVARVNGALGGVAASESFTLSQGYYFGATPKNDYRVLVTFDDPSDGTYIDELNELDRIAIGKKQDSKPDSPSKPAGPVTLNIFDDAVARVGRLLVSGDGRRDLLKTYIASRSAKRLPADELRLLVAGVAQQYFDPDDPKDDVNIDQIIEHFAAKDALPAIDFSGLLAETVDPQTGEVTKVHPLARYLELDAEPKPPRWVIPGFIGHGVTVISGAAGVGKTTALLPLALTAAGLHGGDLMPRQWRHVVYVTEDAEQARRILAGIVGYSNLGISLEQVRERLHIVEAVRLDPAFVASVGVTYREQFTRTVEGVEVLPLVVLDTKSAVLALENENDNAEASRMMAALKQGFDGLPVWLIGHIAKANIGRADVAGLTSRGAGATEGDGNATIFLIQEGDTRFLVLGKVRFEPKWRELEVSSYTAVTLAKDEFSNIEPVVMRWGVAAPAQQSRKEAAERAAEQQRIEDEATLRQEIRDAVATAWVLGNPLNRAGVKSKVRRKTAEVVTMLENLLSERWLIEISVPAKQRTNNNRSAYLVELTTEEHESVMSGAALPADKLVIPASWQKQQIPSVPELEVDATT